MGGTRWPCPMGSLKIFIDLIFPVALWPWCRLSLENKWASWIFPGWGGKGGRSIWLTVLLPSCASFLEILGSSTFWKPQGLCKSIRRLPDYFYSFNRSQQDALLLKFILVKNTTFFRQKYCPSSGVLILYSQRLVFVILVMLTVC